MHGSTLMFGNIQSALNPHGPEAAGIAEITWILVGGGAAIFALVLTLAALAVFGRRPWLASEAMIIGGGIALPVVVLSALLIHTLLAVPRLPARLTADLVIEVTGHQWWWQIRYLDARNGVEFTTANEIHIPVGREIELRLRSADVLHSFWVPALAGKLDLIPGKDNRLRLSADRAGTFRGQCAEYCGGPHAQMALFVVAEDPALFETWRNAQRLPQGEAIGVEAARGKALFLGHCTACHTVRGTSADGELGPDLTHFASRSSLGAGILPNHPGTVAGWIGGSQHLKPGNLMPEFRSFNSAELQALVAYLGSLR
jgi:cytochrome c oxidase subunit 2